MVRRPLTVGLVVGSQGKDTAVEALALVRVSVLTLNRARRHRGPGLQSATDYDNWVTWTRSVNQMPATLKGKNNRRPALPFSPQTCTLQNAPPLFW
jgi:hypothetical protein